MEGRALSAKELVFVEAYLTTWNATEAARRAGYRHPNKVGPRKLVEVGIQAEIQGRLAELKMGADEVLVRLAEQARGSIADFLEEVVIETDDGEARRLLRVDLSKAERLGKLGNVKKLTPGMFGFGIEL